MGGTTAKSNPAANKLDEKELARLQRQDRWIQITRLKLVMDLIFVCQSRPRASTRNDVYSLTFHSL